MTRTLTFTLAAAATCLVLAGCSGSELASAPFSADGTLDWSTKLELACSPELWVQFEMTTPMREGQEGMEPVYELEGTMQIQMDDQDWYDGDLVISSDRPPTLGLGRTLAGGRKTCDRKKGRCDISGKLRVFALHYIRAGSTLKVGSKLPMKAEGVQVKSLRMELRN